MTKENRFCGPFALAFVAGIGVNDAAARIRRITGKRCVMGVTNSTMTRALGETNGICRIEGFYESVNEPVKERPTLARWRKGKKGTWVVSLTSHFVVLCNGRIYDNIFPEGLPAKGYKSRARVQKAWQILGRKSQVAK